MNRIHRNGTLYRIFSCMAMGSILLFIFEIMPAKSSYPERKTMITPQMELPLDINGWKRSAAPRIINESTIFDYMNGAGELYIGYRFDHLEVYEYESEGRPNILVEIYEMKTPDDAFGLLSLDWEGESLSFVDDKGKTPNPAAFTFPVALYGQGFLRIRAGRIYARILAERETKEVKEAILKIGQAVTRNLGNPPPPEIIQGLPESFSGGWTLRRDRAAYFRTHLVFNSLYYLGHENMLDLDHKTEAVIAPYEKEIPGDHSIRIHYLFVKYPTSDRAVKALEHFHQIYLPEIPFPEKARKEAFFHQINSLEDGWMGYRIHQNRMEFLFECPDKDTIDNIFKAADQECNQQGE